jgi:rhamnose transport system permease protein
VIAVCAALGALNGVLVVRLALPSRAVTMGAFRGLAFILVAETGYTDFDDSYLYIGSEQAFGSVPISFILFLVIALIEF